LSHPEIFEAFEKYKIDVAHEISKSRVGEAAECITGTYKKLDVD